MSTSYQDGILVVDNANSGTCTATVLDAARYARSLSGMRELTLVIGKARGDGAVCEGFPPDQILSAIRQAAPDTVVWVGDDVPRGLPADLVPAPRLLGPAAGLEEGYSLAKENTGKGSIVLAVKTWR
jgi:hypothetical protein